VLKELISRRSLLVGAPAVVLAANLMPLRGIAVPRLIIPAWTGAIVEHGGVWSKQPFAWAGERIATLYGYGHVNIFQLGDNARMFHYDGTIKDPLRRNI